VTVDKLNRLAKWRSVFAGWQLGTRPDTDPECQAVRDHREATILLRAEASALIGLLIRKGVLTAEEFTAQLDDEADTLSAAYERQFPGMRATDSGIQYDLPEALATMTGWRP
jgi:hypothetical protein